jgi:hypothetical protein
MPHRYFVLDASLFEKYSLDINSSLGEPISIDNVFQRLVNEGKCNWNTSKELNSLIELLEAVALGKAIICRNKRIVEIYEKYLNKIPYEIAEYIQAILANDNCSKRIDDGGLLSDDFDEISGTTLRDKEIYLDIATSLCRRIIVSTEEDKITVYTSVPNNQILFRHGIHCRCTWEHWQEIRSRTLHA